MFVNENGNELISLTVTDFHIIFTSVCRTIFTSMVLPMRRCLSYVLCIVADWWTESGCDKPQQSTRASAWRGFAAARLQHAQLCQRCQPQRRQLHLQPTRRGVHDSARLHSRFSRKLDSNLMWHIAEASSSPRPCWTLLSSSWRHLRQHLCGSRCPHRDEELKFLCLESLLEATRLCQKMLAFCFSLRTLQKQLRFHITMCADWGDNTASKCLVMCSYSQLWPSGMLY